MRNWDSVYSTDGDVTEPALDFRTWLEGRTGVPHRWMMREWAQHATDRILSLGPETVIDFGCGSGILLWRLLPHVRRYLAHDLSVPAIELLEKRLHEAAPATRAKVATSSGPQAEFLDRVDRTYDLIIINSVAQYLSATDLEQLLDRSYAQRAADMVYMGDLRNTSARAALYLSAAERLHSDRSVEYLSSGGLEFLQEHDYETSWSPRNIADLAARRHLDSYAFLKSTHGETTMSLFRYDVLLRPAADARPTPDRLVVDALAEPAVAAIDAAAYEEFLDSVVEDTVIGPFCDARVKRLVERHSDVRRAVETNTATVYDEYRRIDDDAAALPVIDVPRVYDAGRRLGIGVAAVPGDDARVYVSVSPRGTFWDAARNTAEELLNRTARADE